MYMNMNGEENNMRILKFKESDEKLNIN